MDSLEKFYKEAQRQIQQEKNRADFYEKVSKAIAEKYLKPGVEKKIKEEPFRITSAVGTRRDESAILDGGETSIQINKVVYILEKQKYLADGIYYNRYEEKEPYIETTWDHIGVFDSEEEAREMARVLSTKLVLGRS